MGVCKRVSDLNAVLSFFEEAKSDGIQPNEFMYSSAIWTAASVKNANCARMLLDKMMREHLVPNAVCFDGGKLLISLFSFFDLHSPASMLLKPFLSVLCSGSRWSF
jgi:hypothetical protein